MKNNIKKAPVKFQEDLLNFHHFMLIFVFAQISDYHHLKSNKSKGFQTAYRLNFQQKINGNKSGTHDWDSEKIIPFELIHVIYAP